MPSFRYSWVGRHVASLGISAGTIAAIAATVVANLKLDIDPFKAFAQYGLPTALCVCLGAALAWIIIVYLPRREEQHQEILRQANSAASEQMTHLRDLIDASYETAEKERQLDREMFRDSLKQILAAHAEDRTEFRDGLKDVRTQVERIHDRLDSMTTGPREKLAMRKPRSET